MIARYLHHRVCTDRPDTHPWILTIRETCERLAEHTTPSGHSFPLEEIRTSACLCLAVNANDWVFKGLLTTDELLHPNNHLVGAIWENCLAIAAWMGDLKVVHSLLNTQAAASDDFTPLDPPSFFGRPSWAAAASGNLRIYQWFLKRGALPFEPRVYCWHNTLVLGENPLVAAAHMGHDSIVRAILQAGGPETRRDVSKAVRHAAYANQPQTLRTLLEQFRQHPATSQAKLLEQLDYNLAFCSCPRGAPDSTRVLLEYGAHPDATDYTPRSCLQLAAKAGDARTVRLLLEVGASLEAPEYILNRIQPEMDGDRNNMNQPRKKRRDALAIAKKRNWREVVRLLEEKKREIERSNNGDGLDIGAAV